jgi:hypothetical protein
VARSRTPASSSAAAASTAAATDGAGDRVSEDEPEPIGRRVTVGKLAVGFAPIVLFGAAVAFDIPICPARVLLGIPCPGCGLTRATIAMVTLDFGEMAHFNPLAPIIAPLFIYGIVRVALVTSGILPRGLRDPVRRVPEWAWTLMVALVLGTYFLRMAGMLGGMPDTADLTQGLIYRGASAVLSVLFPA